MAETYLKIHTTPPEPVHLMDWLMSLGEIADSVSAAAGEIEAVISLGHAVQVAALAALATPPPELPPEAPPAYHPDDARDWMVSHGEIADEASNEGREALISAGEAVSAIARCLVMECPDDLAAMIREAMP